MLRAIQFVKSGYFPNRDQECLNSSVANLLVELNDRETAQYFYENYRSHVFVDADGRVKEYLASSVVNDLVGDLYDVKLFLNISRDKLSLYNSTERTIIIDEIQSGRLIHTKKHAHKPPVCLFVIKEKVPHVILQKEDKLYIDDGIECIGKYDVYGFLTLTHN